MRKMKRKKDNFTAAAQMNIGHVSAMLSDYVFRSFYMENSKNHINEHTTNTVMAT